MLWQMKLDFKMANAWANETRFENGIHERCDFKVITLWCGFY